MRAKRIDRNHKSIRDQLRSVLGSDNVIDTHDLGRGFGDLVVGHCGTNYIFEIKFPGCSLTDDEEYFHNHWDGQILIIETAEQALEAMGVI